jgi:uncharacterized membrane protein
MPKWSTRDLLLAGSIAVNLVLLGFVVGAGVRLAGPGAPRTIPIVYDEGFSLRALFGSMSEADRDKLRETVMREGARSVPLFRELREARQEFERVARAEPFDAERARAALAEVREAESALQDRSGDLIVRILAELPAEERARVLVEMREGSWRSRGAPGPGDGRRGDGGGRDYQPPDGP